METHGCIRHRAGLPEGPCVRRRRKLAGIDLPLASELGLFERARNRRTNPRDRRHIDGHGAEGLEDRAPVSITQLREIAPCDLRVALQVQPDHVGGVTPSRLGLGLECTPPIIGQPYREYFLDLCLLGSAHRGACPGAI